MNDFPTIFDALPIVPAMSPTDLAGKHPRAARTVDFLLQCNVNIIDKDRDNAIFLGLFGHIHTLGLRGAAIDLAGRREDLKPLPVPFPSHLQMDGVAPSRTWSTSMPLSVHIIGASLASQWTLLRDSPRRRRLQADGDRMRSEVAMVRARVCKMSCGLCVIILLGN